jgi:hypothetical protein
MQNIIEENEENEGFRKEIVASNLGYGDSRLSEHSMVHQQNANVVPVPLFPSVKTG